MKSLLGGVGVILTVILIFCAHNSFAEIRIKYDRSKDKTKVQTTPKTTPGTVSHPGLVLVGFYDGQTPSKPGSCTLAFAVVSMQGWAYLRCHSINCLADGKRVELPPFEHRGEVRKAGGVFEFISTVVPFNLVEQLSNSQKVEFKLCNTEFVPTKQEMEDLRTFVDAFKQK